MPYLSDRFHDQNNSSPAPLKRGAVNRTGTFDAAAATAAIGRRVLGQAAALAAVEHALVIAQAGFHDRERPLASLLLVGPTGVGKTELVRQLGAEIRGGPDDLCRVDMGQLAQEHYAASLAGAPPGYAGSRESSSIFDRSQIEGTPYSPGIVLFDEVEKAHPIVLRALLGVLDHGRLTLANGEQTISFRNAFVFMTSNLGSAHVARGRDKPLRKALDALHHVPSARMLARQGSAIFRRRDGVRVDRAVKAFFDPEFLNRIDEVVKFTEISEATATDIVGLRMDDVKRRFRRRDVDLIVNDHVIDALVVLGFDPVNGARSLGRVVREHVLVPVARALVKHRGSGAAGDGVLQISLDAVSERGSHRLVATVRTSRTPGPPPP